MSKVADLMIFFNRLVILVGVFSSRHFGGYDDPLFVWAVLVLICLVDLNDSLGKFRKVKA